MTNPSPLQGSSEAIQRIVEMADAVILIEVIVEALRQRFSQEFDSDPVPPWKWVEDVKSTGILIENGFTEHAETRNGRPGIWVDRTNTITMPASIGDQDQHPEVLATGATRHYARTETDITVDCTAEERGESMLIGSIAHIFLVMTQHPLMGYFGIHDVSPFSMGQTVPYERDKQLWSTPIQFRLGIETRWNVRESLPLLSTIVMRVTEKIRPSSYRLMELNIPENEP